MVVTQGTKRTIIAGIICIGFDPPAAYLLSDVIHGYPGRDQKRKKSEVAVGWKYDKNTYSESFRFFLYLVSWQRSWSRG